MSAVVESLNGMVIPIKHSIPTALPNKAKQEEVLAVAALLFSMSSRKFVKFWLLVLWPKDGLLAGQWLRVPFHLCLE